MDEFPNCAVIVSRKADGGLLIQSGIYCRSAVRLDAEIKKRPDIKEDDPFWDSYKRQADAEVDKAVREFIAAEREALDG